MTATFDTSAPSPTGCTLPQGDVSRERGPPPGAAGRLRAVEDVRGPVVALVPARAPGEGKTRLSDELSPSERASLSGAMLADVARALAASRVDRIVVAASGPEAAAAASALGLDVVLDPPSVRSLNAALGAAQLRVGAAGTLVVVTADLPRLSPRDVDTLVATDAQVVVAGTDDGGTGGLLRRPPGAIAPAYGPASAARHLARARAAGFATVALDLPGFRHDVDTWEDLLALRRGPIGSATAAFLAGLGGRLDAAG